METVKITNWEDYQQAAMRTCTDRSFCFEYMAYGLVGEIGELAGKLAKEIRDDVDADLHREGVKLELGDIAWMCAGMAAEREVPDTLLRCQPTEHVADFDMETSGIQVLQTMMVAAAELLGTGNLPFGMCGLTDLQAQHLNRIWWCLDHIAGMQGLTMREVCQANIDKLTDRANRNKIHGDGDER